MTKIIEANGLPGKVKLLPAEAKALQGLSDKKGAIDVFVKTIMQQGESRMAELNAEGRKIWEGIQRQHEIDLNNVNYDLDDDGKHLVPTGMKL